MVVQNRSQQNNQTGGMGNGGGAPAATEGATAQDTRRQEQQEAMQEFQPSLRLDRNKVASRGPWYMEDREDLKHVTDEAVNEAIGVENIAVLEPTDNQLRNRIIAKVSLHLKGVTIQNIIIGESTRSKGNIYMQLPSREITQENDQRTRYSNDIQLNDDIQAQVLRHVHGLLTPVEQQ